MYWLEAFVYQAEYPESSNPKGIYVIFTDDPEVMQAGFDAAEHKVFPKTEVYSGERDIVRYGETIPLYLETHRLPDLTLDYHNYGLFEITVFAAKNNQAVSDTLTYRQASKSDPVTFNGLTKLNIPVMEEWRDKVGHKPNTQEEFYAELQPYMEFNPNAVEGEKTNEELPVGVLTNEALTKMKYGEKVGTEIQAPNDQMVLVSYNRANPRDFALPDQSFNIADQLNKGALMLASAYRKKEIGDTIRTTNTFLVPWDTFADILDRRKTKVGDKMAAILDRSFEAPKFEFCKYTAINLKVGDKDVVPVFAEIEDKGVQDKTNLIYGVIAGDNKAETVAITLDNLSHAGTPVQCLEIGGREHASIEDVIRIKDDATEQWLEEGEKSEGNQSLRSNYKFTDKGIELYLKYPYNRSYDTRAEEWLGNTLGEWTDELINLAWIVRYLFLWENDTQSYYVPIHTCRYPDQVVKLQVYPDVEWYVNFKFNTDRPVYVKQDKNYKSREYHTGKDKQKAGLKYGRERALMKKSSAYTLDVVVGIKVNGKSYDVTFNNKQPIFRTINFCLEAYEALNKLLMSDESKESLPAAKSSKMGARVGRGMPVRIEVHRPAFSGGIWCKYTPSKTQQEAIGWYLKLAFKSEPFLSAEGRLDLLFFAQALPVAGQFITALNRIIDGINLLTFGAVNIEYYIDIVVYTAANIEVKPVAYHSIDGWEGPGIAIEAVFEIGLEAGGSVKIDAFNIEGQGKIHAEGKAKFKAYAAYSDRERSCPADFDFEGLEALVFIRFELNRSDKNSRNPKREDKPHKIPLLSGVKGPKIELFKA
ncbi:hypothetical protein [Sinomicrobium sp. M5D2P17]